MDISKEELMALLAERAKQIGAIRAALREMQADIEELQRQVAALQENPD